MTKTHEKLKKQMPRSRNDFAIEKGRCERWKSMDPIFINLSVAYFPPIRSHEIPRVLAYQGDVEKVFTFCFLFLGDPAQNSGFGANTK